MPIPEGLWDEAIEDSGMKLSGVVSSPVMTTCRQAVLLADEPGVFLGVLPFLRHLLIGPSQILEVTRVRSDYGIFQKWCRFGNGADLTLVPFVLVPNS